MSNSAETNVAALKAAYARWNDSKGADHACWLDLVADNVSIFSLCDGRAGFEFATDCTCREDAVRYLSGLTETWEMEFYRIDEFVAEGERVVAMGRTAWTHKATGKRAESAKIDIWCFQEGQAVDFREYYDTATVIEAATG